MKESKDRRDVLKGIAVVALGGAVGGMGFTKEALAQTPMSTTAINPRATAVLPDGSIKTRAEILTTLGLDASTAADKWLVITSCSANAAGLTPATRDNLMKRGIKMDPAMQKTSPMKLR